jgi:transcriptional regulator with XRE-family HTH domain
MEPARIKAIRRRLGMTQRQLAERLGVHVVTVKKWETGAYRIGRSAAVRLWLLEQGHGESGGDAAALPAVELVDALSRKDAGGVIAVARSGEGAAGSVTVNGEERRFVRYDAPGRTPGVVFAFPDMTADEFEAVRLELLEQVLATAEAARAETEPSPDHGPRSRSGPRPQWISADWLRRPIN